jgi:hypothetical protein
MEWNGLIGAFMSSLSIAFYLAKQAKIGAKMIHLYA